MVIGGQRTKPIEAGIVKRVDSPGQVYIDYQPGNGTRYPLLFVRIQPGECSRALGIGSGSGWVVTWISSSRSNSMILADATFVSDSYVHQELARTSDSQGDAICLAEIIGFITGCKSSRWVDYEPELDNQVAVRQTMEL